MKHNRLTGALSRRGISETDLNVVLERISKKVSRDDLAGVLHSSFAFSDYWVDAFLPAPEVDAEILHTTETADEFGGTAGHPLSQAERVVVLNSFVDVMRTLSDDNIELRRLTCDTLRQGIARWAVIRDVVIGLTMTRAEFYAWADAFEGGDVAAGWDAQDYDNAVQIAALGEVTFG